MNKKLLVFGLALAVVALLTGCGKQAGTSSSNQMTVNMGATTFSSQSVTISKGSTIMFTDDAVNGTPHILVIGKDGAAAEEEGAPDLGGASGHMLQPGQSWTTPAWDTSGTFYVTCTLHPTTMTLTVTVTG
ncbi:MAG TPA: plastocyanin/azurin family copper-binding protein [Ktedonobacterales bacterium]|jgi:plastocyanin